MFNLVVVDQALKFKNSQVGTQCLVYTAMRAEARNMKTLE